MTGQEDDLWECDGGDFYGSFDEVNEHVITVNTLRDGSLRPPLDVTCWGAMQVGSVAWESYHYDGIHPMQHLMTNLHHIAARFPSLFPEGRWE